MMRIEILTLFPDFFPSTLAASLIGKGIERGRIEVVVTDVREFADGAHRIADDTPYGGGNGMVMKVEPLVAALRAAQGRALIPGGSFFRRAGERSTRYAPEIWLRSRA